jgi:uncharacterized iron-regulated membrane protein
VGVLAGLNLFVLITTGLLMQCRERLRLEEKYVSRRFLPGSYRPNDGPEVRSDIVVTDVHSGKIFGQTGMLIVNGMTLAWLTLLVSGLVIFGTRYLRSKANNTDP